MRVVLFVHSVVSDWSHGNAHFLRGLMRALQARGHDVTACEPRAGWSVQSLFDAHGHLPLVEFGRRFPDLDVRTYDGDGTEPTDEVDALTRGADLVLAHEFNHPGVVSALGRLRCRRGDFRLLFHDTHHRAVSARDEMKRFDLTGFDGVLAFGASLADVWRRDYGQPRVWTFHEAADTTLFKPAAPLPRATGSSQEADASDTPPPGAPMDDVVWIGNWGDEERSAEIRAYLVESARAMPDLRFAVYGVRYPEQALRELEDAGIDFRGWLPNHRVPEAYARARMTVHIPRGPYLDRLPGIPTIRPFEALACGIPLLSTPWPDREGLFREGRDFLVVRTPEEMRTRIRELAESPEARQRLAECGLETIRARHTCDHRAAQLEAVLEEIR